MKYVQINKTEFLTWDRPGELQESLQARRRSIGSQSLRLLSAQPIKELSEAQQSVRGHITQVSNEPLATVYPVVADVLRPEEPMSLHHPVGDVSLLPGQTGGRGLEDAGSRVRFIS